ILAQPLECMSQAAYDDISTARVLAELQKTPLPDTATGVAETGRLRNTSGVGGYLERLYENRLLTPDEECQAFRRMNLAKHHALILRESLTAVRPSVTLMERIEYLQNEALVARDLLIRCNLRLVVSIAKKFAGDDNPVDDLISEGHLALFRSVEKFDHARGFRFSTYATHAIRRQIHRLVMKQQRDRRRGMHGGEELLPTIPAAENAEPAPALTTVHAAVEKAVQRLDSRERMIVRARYGISTGGQPRTLIDLAGQLGVCKERVRQLELRALKKLRAAMENDRIHAAMLEG
ncbi:MAG: sigma-70 family RNA polymerase sigma factor, partial [Pirellulales bacterium]